MYTADWYREFESDLDEYERNVPEEFAQVCVEEKIDVPALRQYISERIMQLEVEEFTREARPRVGDHQASFTYPGESLRETRGRSQTFKEAPMPDAISYPGKSFSEPSTPVSPNAQGEYGYLRNLLDGWVTPLKVVAGPVQGPVDNRAPRPVAGEDSELLEKTKHVRLKGERMMQFYARVGLGAAQIRTMSFDEITRFCDVAEETLEQTPKVFEPRPTSRKIKIALV
jgi:hypothetical protein